jgi:hypothetical protein
MVARIIPTGARSETSALIHEIKKNVIGTVFYGRC